MLQVRSATGPPDSGWHNKVSKVAPEDSMSFMSMRSWGSWSRLAGIEMREQVQDEQRTRGAHGAVVASGRHHDLGLDHVGVHAHLGVVVQADQGPVCDRPRHAAPAVLVGLHDEVLHGCCVEQLDVGRLHMRSCDASTSLCA